jgi:hypothetical protein
MESIKPLEIRRLEAGTGKVLEIEDSEDPIDVFDLNCRSLDRNWQDIDGNCDGGVSVGFGYTIAWQRGSLIENGRNGAFLIEVLRSCARQLKYYQSTKFVCEENGWALEQLLGAIEWLEKRRDRQEIEGTLGTHEA